MTNKVLSIELGDSLIKVCELDYHTKNPKIYHNFVISTPQNMIMDGIINIQEDFSNLFHAALDQYKIRTRKVIFSISSSKIATREAKIPFCKPNRIADVVRANLLDYFPIDSSKYLISHTILGIGHENNSDDTNGIRPTGYRLLVLAVPKPLIESYHQFAKKLGLEVAAIDYNGNSIYQAVKEECKEGTQFILKVSENSSLVLVIKNNIIVLNRTIAYGINDAIETLADTESFGQISGYIQALKIAKNENCFLTEEITNNSEEDELVQRLLDKQKITQSLRSFISSVVRVIDYYNSNHSTEPIEKMILTGLGADIKGLDLLLTNEVGFKVSKLSKFNAKINEETLKNNLNLYIACIGATIHPVTFYSDTISETSGGKLTFNSKKVSTFIFFTGLIIGVIIVIVSTVPYVLQQKQKKAYEEVIHNLQPAYETYVQYQNLNEEVSQLNLLDEETNNRNDELVSFVEALEEKMPSSFYLNSMTVTKEGITLDVSVGSKEEVASVLSELKALCQFASVDTTSVTEISSEIGEKQYSFSVDLIYLPIFSETENEVN